VLSFQADEKISSVIPVREFEANAHLLMATKRGTVKKTSLTDYSRPRAGGIIGIGLDEGDDLISVVLTRDGDEVVLSSKDGMAIRFAEADARAMGRGARGVRGINLAASDEVVGMVVADPVGYLLTVCEKGFGKRTPFGANTAEEAAEDESAEPEALPEQSDGAENRSQMRYRRQRRGGKGVIDIRTSDRNGPVVGVVSVRDGDEVMLITAQGMVNRTKVDEIRVVGRNTQGVRVMNVEPGDALVTAAKIARDDVENGAAAPFSTSSATRIEASIARSTARLVSSRSVASATASTVPAAVAKLRIKQVLVRSRLKNSTS
jgi:DNA gyrase subunit A